jgi:HSP20 family protein
MALVRWEPVSMNRLFTTLFDTPTGAAPTMSRWIPAMDFAETDDAYVLRADLPGLTPDDVSIELEHRVLTISGERRAEDMKEGTGWRRVERSFGKFQRSITLPEGVDADAVTASFDNGVLSVTIPKPEERRPRKVAIAVEGAQPKAIEGSEAS